MFKQPKLEIHFTRKRANSLLREINCFIQVFFWGGGHALVHFHRNVSPLIVQQNILFLSSCSIFFFFLRPGTAFPLFALPQMKKTDPDPELANRWDMWISRGVWCLFSHFPRCRASGPNLKARRPSQHDVVFPRTTSCHTGLR